MRFITNLHRFQYGLSAGGGGDSASICSSDMAYIRNSISGVWLRVDNYRCMEGDDEVFALNSGVITRREHGCAKCRCSSVKTHVAVGCLILTTTPRDSVHRPAGSSTSAH